MKAIHSLQTKLTASFAILVLAITSLTFAITYRETRSALKETVQTELLAVVSVIASQLHGPLADTMAGLQPGDEQTERFRRVRDRLKAMKDAHPDIKYVYTMVREEDGSVAFLADPDYGNPDDPGAAIGEPYEDVAGKLLEGFDRTVVDDDYTTDRWGTFLSAFSPIRNSHGNIVALVGVDMIQDRVLKRQAFIGNTIYLVMAGGIGIAALFIFLFSRTIIRDVRRLNRVANTISMGDMDVDVDVERKDEIGELSESFGRMVASLKIMMMAKGR